MPFVTTGHVMACQGMYLSINRILESAGTAGTLRVLDVDGYTENGLNTHIEQYPGTRFFVLLFYTRCKIIIAVTRVTPLSYPYRY